MLDVAGLPRSTYYYYTKKQKDPDKYSELKAEKRDQCLAGELSYKEFADWINATSRQR